MVNGKMLDASGTVAKVKTVTVRDNKHLVVLIKGDNDKQVAVDMGPKDAISAEVKQGDMVKVSGPAVMVGNKPLLIAQKAEVGGKKIDVEHFGRTYQGTIDDVHKAKVRDAEHLLARVKTDDNKLLLVDMGQADTLRVTPKKGDKLNITGVPVKVKDRPVLLAQRIETSDGQVIQVHRGSMKQKK